jgi:hypothetical protein
MMPNSLVSIREFGVRTKMEVAEYIRNITKEDDKIWTTEADIAFFAQRLIVTPNSTMWKYQGFYEDVWGIWAHLTWGSLQDTLVD